MKLPAIFPAISLLWDKDSMPSVMISVLSNHKRIIKGDREDDWRMFCKVREM